MPQAILLDKVADLGEKGDVVVVSKGFMRNYLAPRGLAREASDAAIAEAKRRAEEEERARRDAIERADEYAALLSKTVLTIARQAGEDGRLFGSVTGADVADAIRDARGIKVDKRKVRLESPIKEIGTHMVEVEIAGGNVASVKTMIVASS
ncbi:MAG: 50S ribosomal protein L9 [Actinomycetes bacterium]